MRFRHYFRTHCEYIVAKYISQPTNKWRTSIKNTISSPIATFGQHEIWTYLPFSLPLPLQHNRLNLERRLSDRNAGDGKAQGVKTSDVARLMELFQVNAQKYTVNIDQTEVIDATLPLHSSLLKYWEFIPSSDDNLMGGCGLEKGYRSPW